MAINVVSRTDADTFVVAGNQTDVFHAGRRVKMEGGADVYGTILSSNFDDPNTSVNLTAASPDINAGITGVSYGVVSSTEGITSMPIHDHVGEGSGGEVDHGGLGGLSGDDHSQYHNDTRGDARYYTQGEVDTEIDADITTHTALANAHHNESHTIVSHSDTTATGAELNTLTGGGDTALHDHAGISENTTHRTSDGSNHSFIDQSVISGASPTFDGNNFTGVDADDVDVADSTDYFVGTDVEAVLAEMGETNVWNGYDLLDPDTMGTLTWTNGTRTVALAVTGGQSEYHFWCNGKKITNTTTKSVVIPEPASGTFYIYMDAVGDMQYVAAASVTADIFFNLAITAIVNWNTTTNIGKCGNEQHGIRMSASTHYTKHFTTGAQYSSGFDITGLSDGGTTFTQLNSGVYFDEDIRLTLSVQSTMGFMHRSGADADSEWTFSAASNLVGYNGGSGDYCWNEESGGNWSLTTITGNDCAIMFVMATNDIDDACYQLLGQNLYANANTARNAIESEINTLQTAGLPNPEFLFLHAYIIDSDGLRLLSDGSTHLDLRAIKGGSPSSASPSSIAADILTTVSSFGSILSSADTDVQAALDTIDDHNHSGTYEPADATIIKQADVDDTPVNGVTTAPVSSNWAYDHANASNPHSVTENVSTNITVVEAPTIVTVQSSDGDNDFIAAADETNAGVMTTTMYDEHVLNNAKDTYPGSADVGELNILDGATVTTAELNILDGVTSTATELNLLDGLTVLSGSNTGDDPGLENVVEDTAPSLGGYLDITNYGTKITSQNTSAAGAAGDLMYLSAANTWALVDADADTTSTGMLGICLVDNATTGEILVKGMYTTSGLTSGNIYYVHTTAGDWTNTAPSGAGDIVRIIGYALSTTELFFDPDKTFVEIAA